MASKKNPSRGNTFQVPHDADLADKVARAIHAERTPSPFEWLPTKCQEMYFRMALKAIDIVKNN